MSEGNRPRVRADCSSIPRPCPYVSCRHHLLLEVRGKDIWVNYPRRRRLPMSDDEAVVDLLDVMGYSCSLDRAEEGEQTLDEIAHSVGVTRQGIDCAVKLAQKKFLKRAQEMGIDLGDD